MKTIQIYGHYENVRDPKLVDIPENLTVQEVLTQLQREFGIPANGQEASLFLQDEEAPLQKSENAEKAGIKRKVHVHCHRCQKVQVTVFYNGEDKVLSFQPSATGKNILKKAIKAFSINEADAGDYLLKLDDKTIIQATDHIGSFISYPHCEVKLFLTPTKPVQG